MLTSNHTSQMQLHQHMLWANNEGMLASTFNCFFGIPSKHLLLSSSTLKACIPRICHAAGIPAVGLVIGWLPQKCTHPKTTPWVKEKPQQKSSSKLIQLVVSLHPFGNNTCATSTFPLRSARSWGCSIGGFKFSKRGSVLEDLILEWWSTGICFRCLEKAKHILPNRGLMALHHGINLKITN